MEKFSQQKSEKKSVLNNVGFPVQVDHNILNGKEDTNYKGRDTEENGFKNTHI